MSYEYPGHPRNPFPSQMPANSMGSQMPPGNSPYPMNCGPGYNQSSAAPIASGMPQPFAPYSATPYPSNQPHSNMPYAPQGGYQQPLSQPQQYHMQQSGPPGPYSQQGNSNVYPNYPGNTDSSHFVQAPHNSGNPSYPASNNPYAPNTVPYPSHPTAHPQNPVPYPSHPTGHPQNSSPYPSHPPQPQNPNSYPGHFVPFDTSSSSYSNNAAPQSQHSSPYTGGQGTGVTHSQQYVNTVSSFPPQYGAPTPLRAQPNDKLSPTVVPYQSFDSRQDAEALRTAMKGWGTDEKAIINVLANRTNSQRQEIAQQFKTLYGKDLIRDLKSELSNNLEKLIIAMVTPLPQYYAKELHDAMSGSGTDECVLIEVLCTMPNNEIRVIQRAYQSMYGRTLENDLVSDTSGCFERLMVSLCCANRDESSTVDAIAAQRDARALWEAGELRFGTDESTFNQILVQRSVAQLQQIFVEYEAIAHHGIQRAIEKEFSGDIKKGLLAIVKCVQSRPAFFAEQLYKSMKGCGTQDYRLIRLVVTRSEIDMREIKQAFQQEYKQSLEDFIANDCSGDYKKCLLALID